MSAEIIAFAPPSRIPPTTAPVSCVVIEHKPTTFYLRKAVREATNKAAFDEVGFALCGEIEALRSFIESMGRIPPQQSCTVEEAEAKGWA